MHLIGSVCVAVFTAFVILCWMARTNHVQLWLYRSDTDADDMLILTIIAGASPGLGVGLIRWFFVPC